MARRTRLAAVLTLAMINVFTLAAGITVARMLPPRLAALKVPTVAAKPVSQAGPVLAPAGRDGTLPTANGLRSALAGPLSAAALGPQVSAVVADPASADADAALARVRPAVFYGRGDADQVIPIDAVTRTVEWLGEHADADVEVYAELAHGVSQDELDDLNAFISRVTNPFTAEGTHAPDSTDLVV